MSFSVAAYLRRLGLPGPLEASLENLRRLQQRHIETIPFENLDIHLGKPIKLEPDALFDKLITRQRGGYCYEVNGAFYRLLSDLGYQTQAHLARPMLGFAGLAPYTHRLSSVWLAGKRWLLDVGFGGFGLLDAMEFEPGKAQQQGHETFRVVVDAERGFVLQSRIEGGAEEGDYLSLYSFTLEDHPEIDYALPNYYNSTSPDSLFTRKILCARVRDGARLLLDDLRFKTRRGPVVETATVGSHGQLADLLWEQFGLGGVDGRVLYEKALQFSLATGAES